MTSWSESESVQLVSTGKSQFGVIMIMTWTSNNKPRKTLEMTAGDIASDSDQPAGDI